MPTECFEINNHPVVLVQKGNDCEYPSNVTTWTMHGIWYVH